MFTKLQFINFLKLQFTFLAGVLLISACAPAAMVANPPVNTVIPAAEEPAQIEVSSASIPATEVLATSIPAAQPPSDTGTLVTFGPLTLVVPPVVASGASSSDYPRNDSEDAAWWQKTPGHLQIMLGDYYVLKGQLHQPQIFVYPAQEYAELVPAAFESIRRVGQYFVRFRWTD